MRYYLFLGLLFMGQLSLAKENHPEVTVIGAGLAGLTVAHRLNQQGVNVHVYEARPRVGGRVLTVLVNGHTAELGGQNLYDGGDSKNILGLIREMGLEIVESQIDLTYRHFDGKKMIAGRDLLKGRFDPETLMTQLQESADRSQNMEEVLKEFVPEEEPLYKVLRMRLSAYEGAPINRLSTIYIKTLYQMLLGGISPTNSTIGEQSYLNHASIKGGNSLLTEKLKEALGDRVHTNRRLMAVAKNFDGTYALTFQKGERIHTNRLVLTIPCSVYDSISFQDEVIPAERLENIKKVQYGVNAKIILPFACAPKVEGVFTNDRLLAFFKHDSYLLNFYYTGDEALFSEDNLPEVYEAGVRLVTAALGKECLPIEVPVLAKDEAFSKYNGPVGHSWPKDPYAKGSYSCIAPGQEKVMLTQQKEGGEMVKSLFAPIEQKIYFAGEHTSILDDAPGTMEAACESAERNVRIMNWQSL